MSIYAFYGTYWCAKCNRFTRWLFVGDSPQQCTECEPDRFGDNER